MFPFEIDLCVAVLVCDYTSLPYFTIKLTARQFINVIFFQILLCLTRDKKILYFSRLQLGAFDIEYLKARHIYVGSLTCDNYVYKVTAGNRSVVITGDTDPESLGRITDVFGCDSDVFLINAAIFLYEMKRAETTILKSIKNLYVYHLTAEDNDDYGYRKATVSIMGKARQYLSNTKYLLDNVTYI